MRKSIIFALMLTIAAQGAWAQQWYGPTQLGSRQSQGPWVFEDVANDLSNSGTKQKSWNDMNHRYAWGEHDDRANPITYQSNDADGLGFVMHCKSDVLQVRYGVYSLYSHSESVPAYTCKRLTWKYKVLGYTNCHPQNVALYARDNIDDMKSTAVNFTEGANTSSPYYLAGTTIGNGTQTSERRSETAELTKTFDFDNSNGAAPQTKTWVLMLTHCARNDGNSMRNLHQWGSFKDAGYTWTTLYYKYVTFEANGGTGTMDIQKIENSDNLASNAFTRNDYTFAGWSTSQDGEVVYANEAMITATEGDKGPVTLYAKWTNVRYAISYNLDGGTASNPTSYNSVETATFTLSNPTKENYTFLGWTGSNGATPQLSVSIPNGSTGDKTFVAHWIYTAAASAVSLIDAIGTVEHTAESKAKIDAARAAYDALTDGEKADIPAPKLETLRMAEATYAANEPSTIRFMNKDASEQIGDDQQRAIYYPALPQDATKWQSVEKNVSEDKTIVIKAVE